MMKFTDGLWVGSSDAWMNAKGLGIDAVLNVAYDLKGGVSWPDMEYMQVGLIDGPGNPLAAYHAAILALVTLFERWKKVLVHCHMGRSRSVAVALMYLSLTCGKGWDWWMVHLNKEVGIDVPEPHNAHREAFNKMNWRLLSNALGE